MLPNLQPDGYLRTEQKHPNDRAHWWDMETHQGHVAAPPARDFPRTVYQAGSQGVEQVDHPGNKTLTVASAAELEAALAAGWSLEPIPVDD